MAQMVRRRQRVVATVVYCARALDHLEEAFEALRRDNPLAGRRLHGDIRELVISYGPSGYVALYRFVPARQEVRILAIGHQRELHYRP
jgi:plasmid stabilization system protein ParE